jgi:hypothetical protein
MKFNLNKFWIFTIILLILAVPVGAFKVNDMLIASNKVTTPQAHSMNLKLYANQNYTGKLNGTGAKTYEISRNPKNGTVTLNTTSGKFIYTPKGNFKGTDSFTYKALNGKIKSKTATVKITVNNNKPTASKIDLEITHDSVCDGVLNGGDKDGDKLTYKISQPVHGKVILNATSGKFTYKPNQGFVGTDTFTYYTNDGVSNSNNAAVKITVKNNNPTARNLDLTMVHDRAYDGVLNGSDADGDKLIYNLISKPNNGILTLNDDGTYTYTPKKGFVGTDSFSYRTNDGVSDSQLAAVKINCINTVPEAHDLRIRVNMDQVNFGNLYARDADGDNLTYRLVSAPSNGNITLYADGKYEYTPNQRFMGIDVFIYCVNDGVSDSKIAMVNLAVTESRPQP